MPMAQQLCVVATSMMSTVISPKSSFLLPINPGCYTKCMQDDDSQRTEHADDAQPKFQVSV